MLKALAFLFCIGMAVYTATQIGFDILDAIFHIFTPKNKK